MRKNLEEITKLTNYFNKQINEANDPKYLNDLAKEISKSKLNKKDKAYLIYEAVVRKKYELSEKLGLR